MLWGISPRAGKGSWAKAPKPSVGEVGTINPRFKETGYFPQFHGSFSLARV
jgi:hypothetical protein